MNSLRLLPFLVLAASAHAAEMFPFQLPWDDATESATNVSWLNDKPAGRDGFVHVKDGHLFAGEKRLRIFGVNTCFSANFPDKEMAPKVAARMAKFGINCVRFHHMDMMSAPGGIFAQDGRTLDAGQLDRLDFFISELKKNGIYADLNLHVSRTYPDRPRAEKKGNPDFDKGVDNYCAAMIALQHDYARDLLTHLNAYTGHRYADEPAVALVEINNENALGFQWWAGQMDDLPAPYLAELETLWGAWILKRHGSDDAARKAWSEGAREAGAEMLPRGSAGVPPAGSGVSPEPSNVVKPPPRDTPSANERNPTPGASRETRDAAGGTPALPDARASRVAWSFENHGGALAKGAEKDGTITVNVTKPGTESWHVQFSTAPLAVKAESYEVRFRVKATAASTLSVALMQSHEPWKVLGSANAKAGTDWRDVAVTVRATEADTNARLTIGGMGTTTGTFEFADFSLRTAGVDGSLIRITDETTKGSGSAGVPPAGSGVSPEPSNVARPPQRDTPPANERKPTSGASRETRGPAGGTPALPVQGRVVMVRKRDLARTTPAKQRDWQEFIWDTETAYWNGMRDFLKKELGVKAPIVGTQGFWSPGHVQAGMDVIDSHAYWHHPDFHGRGWNPDVWDVKNEPMAGTPDGGTLPGLAAQRVAGKPFICTEYNHPAPNTYSAETFPLLCAFAALQDWDGVFAFSYSHRGSGAWAQDHFDNFFDIDRHPVKMATLPGAVISFRRGDIERLPGEMTRKDSIEFAIGEALRSGPGFARHSNAFAGNAAFSSRLASVLVEREPGASLTGSGVSDSLHWEAAAGRAMSITNRSLLFVGQMKSATPMKAPPVTRVFNQPRPSFAIAPTQIPIPLAPGETRQGWACYQLTVLDRDERADFSTAKRILITATGDIENTGMGWKNAEKTSVGRDWGKAPVLVEGPAAKIELPGGGKFKAWALDERGQRRAEIPVVMENPSGVGTLEIGPQWKTLWYEVVRE